MIDGMIPNISYKASREALLIMKIHILRVPIEG
jgi:hypothetical protein